MIPKFKSLSELHKAFPDEKACIKYLEKKCWANGVVSPFDPTSKVYHCKSGRYFCRNTNKYFNVKTGTLFENTKLPLFKWFLAIWFVTSHKKGISSLQLSRDVGVARRTAWFILHKIRECYKQENDIQLEGIVEIDETFVGGLNENRHWNKKVPKCQGRSYKDKTPVFGMLQRDGKIVAIVVPNTKVQTLQPLILEHVKKGSNLYTDEWNYGRKIDELYNHKQIYHAANNYANGDVTTNRIEGFWSILKRGIIGIYHSISRKHLQRYVNEFTFRYNYRKISDYDRFNLLLQMCNHRITQKQLINY